VRKLRNKASTVEKKLKPGGKLLAQRLGSQQPKKKNSPGHYRVEPTVQVAAWANPNQ